MTRWLIVAAMAGVAGCVPRGPAPVPQAHYVVGGGYELGGGWSYPREDFHLDETGLASVLPTRQGLTADGEAYDGEAMVAAHRTLQLPAVVRVTNIETGASALVRVNDRGPVEQGRVVGLSRRAAEVLGVMGAAAVRIQIEEGMSQALRAQVGGGPAVTVMAAPRGAVVAETLAPPPGVGAARRVRGVETARVLADAADSPVAAVPERLPEVSAAGVPRRGRIVIRAGSFGRAEYAARLQARLAGIGARIEQVREGRGERYEVLAGPFAGVAAADLALDRAIRAGVGDAKIVIE